MGKLETFHTRSNCSLKAKHIPVHLLRTYEYGGGVRPNQSCEMSILLHGPKPSKQILPQDNCVYRDNFGT